jgi:hypothetical protein
VWVALVWLPVLDDVPTTVGPVTVTERVVEPVAPSSSVTVAVIV